MEQMSFQWQRHCQEHVVEGKICENIMRFSFFLIKFIPKCCPFYFPMNLFTFSISTDIIWSTLLFPTWRTIVLFASHNHISLYYKGFPYNFRAKFFKTTICIRLCKVDPPTMAVHTETCILSWNSSPTTLQVTHSFMKVQCRL